MTPLNAYQLSSIKPQDLQVCTCWDDDVGEWVFGQWLAGPEHFVDAQVRWLDTVTGWRPIESGEG